MQWPRGPGRRKKPRSGCVTAVSPLAFDEDLGLPGRGWRTQGSWSKAQNCIPKISQNRFEWSKIHWHNWAFHIFWMISACRSLLARMILILAPITHNEALAFCCEIQLVSTKEKPFWSLALGGILNYCRFIVFFGTYFLDLSSWFGDLTAFKSGSWNAASRWLVGCWLIWVWINTY